MQVFSLIFFMLLGQWVYALDTKSLWLPRGYQAATKPLIQTASALEKTDRCNKVIRGQLNVDRTTKKNYYFMITCHDKYGRSYNTSYTYPVGIIGAEPTMVYQQKERKNQQCQNYSGLLDGDRIWNYCVKKLKDKTASMIKPVFMEENPEPGLGKLSKYHFEIPFDAQDMAKRRLRYKGVCEVTNKPNCNFNLEIKKR